MSTPATDRKAGPYSGNDSQTEFPFSFRVFAAANIQVIVAISGVEHSLVLDTDYSISLNADQSITPGGTVTYPLSGSPLAEGDTLAIIGALDYAQTLTLPSGGNFSPSAIEAAMDRTVMLTQQLKEEVDRSVKVNVTSGISPDELLDQMAEDVAAAATSAGVAASAAETAAADVSALLDVKVVAATAAKTSAEAARDQVLALYDAFDDRYLGVHASDPATDNDGNPLFPGALYFQQTEAGVDGVMKVYTGTAWVAAYVSGDSVLTAANLLALLATFDATQQATARTSIGAASAADVAAVSAALAALAGVRRLVNRSTATKTTAQSVTGSIPTDDTIPQVGEGTSVLTVAHTPAAIGNRLSITVEVPVMTVSVASVVVATLCRTGVSDALAVTVANLPAGNAGVIKLAFDTTADSVAARTYDLRMGVSSGTLTVLGGGGARWFGGIATARLTVEEWSA